MKRLGALLVAMTSLVTLGADQSAIEAPSPGLSRTISCSGTAASTSISLVSASVITACPAATTLPGSARTEVTIPSLSASKSA